MVILCTGAAGFLGSHLCERLALEGHKVLGIDNLINGDVKNISHIQSDFDFMRGDCTRIGDISLAIKDVDYVIHLAAMGSVPKSFEYPEEFYHNNVDGFTNILKAAKHWKIKKLIYASSSSVYGKSGNLARIESKIGTPQSPYAATKLVNELQALHFSGDIKTVGLRFFNLYGTRQKLGAFIPNIIDAANNNKELTIYGDGNQRRDFTYVKDAVRAILDVLNYKQPNQHCIYNVGAGRSTSLNNIVKIVNTHKKENLKVRYAEARVADIECSEADTTLIQQDVGWQKTYNLAGVLAALLSSKSSLNER